MKKSFCPPLTGYYSISCAIVFCFSIYFANAQGGQPMWKLDGNSVATGKFLGTTNNEPLVFKSNNIEGFRLLPDGSVDFSGNELFNIGFLNVEYSKFDSLNITKKLKVGSNSIVIENSVVNHIYTTDASGGLFLQSQLYDQNTIMNFGNEGNVGIGTDNPGKKLHIKHIIPQQSDVKVLASYDYMMADTFQLAMTIAEMDSIVIRDFFPGSLRLETSIIGGSTSMWDIEPIASKSQSSINKLNFTDPQHGRTIMTLSSDGKYGNVGIGTMSPLQKLHVHNGNIYITGQNSSMLFGNGQNPQVGWGNYGIEYLPENTIQNNAGGLNFWRPFGSTGGYQNFIFHLADNGNVGIGTGNPEYKLEVNKGCIGILPDTLKPWTDRNWRVVVESLAGTAWRMTQPGANGRYLAMGQTTTGWYWILADGKEADSEVRYPMMLNIESDGQPKLVVSKFTWSDYVFDDDYALLSLEERKEFVSANKHLPGIDNEQTIFTEGLDIPSVMEGMTKNLEEHELYIYMLYEMILDLKKENEELRKQIINITKQ